MLSVAGLPQLESNPGAPNTLYLAFDSQTVVMKAGNYQGQTVKTKPFDFDGDPKKIGAGEDVFIRDLFLRVAEDFAPFDVNVTTIDPDSPGSQANPGKTWRVAFVSHWKDVGFTDGGSGCFGCLPGIPVVWWQVIGQNSAQLANTASHEMGHKYTLAHHHGVDANGNVLYDKDGKIAEEYGQGPAGDDWTPIMGNNLMTDRTIWWKETYVYANPSSGGGPPSAYGVMQDDMAALGSILGYRQDDHADNAAGATFLGQASQLIVRQDEGIIGKMTDKDYFSFQHLGGRVQLHVEVVRSTLLPTATAANLDAKLEIRHADGTPLSPPWIAPYAPVSDPGDELGATVTMDLAPGTYTAVVMSHGDYGDVGQYTISLRGLADGLERLRLPPLDVAPPLEPEIPAYDGLLERFVWQGDPRQFDSRVSPLVRIDAWELWPEQAGRTRPAREAADGALAEEEFLAALAEEALFEQLAADVTFVGGEARIARS